MANVRIVLAQGAVDGSNTIFATGVPYVPGTTAYILNGRIHSLTLARGVDNPYGYVELDPEGGTIQVDNPPEIDDVVQIFFWDRRVLPAPPVTRLTGTLRPAAPSSRTPCAPSAPEQQLVGMLRERR